MAIVRANLLDMARLRGGDPVIGLIEENLSYAPEIGAFFARPPITGTKYESVVRTAFPAVGFRSANEGVTAGKSASKKTEVECFIFSGRVEVDKAVGMIYPFGGLAGYEMYEADGVMKNTLLKLGSQIWYGVTQDSKGFPGIKAVTAFGGVTTVDATGSTATTASSVYAVKFGLKDVALVPGQGDVFKLSDFRDETIYDQNDAPLPGRVADLCGWIGLQVAQSYSVGRICNLTAQAGKTLTDSLLADLLAKFPIGQEPDAFFMSRRSRAQLQKSRTVVINASSGGGKPVNVENLPPVPTEAFGIPIITTDSILDTDAIES